MTKAKIEAVYASVHHNILTAGNLDALAKATEVVMTGRLQRPSEFSVQTSVSDHLSISCCKSLRGGVGVIKPFPGEVGGLCGVIIKYSPKTPRGNSVPELQKWIVICHELGHTLLHYHFDGRGGFDCGNKCDPLRETQASYFAKIAICRNGGLRFSEKTVTAKIECMHSKQHPYEENLLP